MLIPVADLYAESFQELNCFQPGQSIPQPQAKLATSLINEILDNWDAERAKVWCEVFASFTLTPSLSPHTIGPSGATFTVAARPETLEGAYLVLNTSTPNVLVPITLIDYQQYQALSVPSIATSIPTALYYEKDWPNGKLFFYPIPNTAYGVRFTLRTLLGQVVQTGSLNMPPGYKAALKYTLSELLATPMGRGVPDETAKQGRLARARIDVNNIIVPLLNLQDGQQERTLTNFNYHSREFT